MGEGASPSPIIIFGESLNALSRSKSDLSHFDDLQCRTPGKPEFGWGEGMSTSAAFAEKPASLHLRAGQRDDVLPLGGLARGVGAGVLHCR